MSPAPLASPLAWRLLLRLLREGFKRKFFHKEDKNGAGLSQLQNQGW